MTILPARITGSQFGSSLNTLVNTWMDIGECFSDVMQRPEVSTLVLHLLPFARAPSILNWTIGSGTGFCSEVYVTRVSPLARWSATSREAQFPNIYQSGPLADPQRTESDHEVDGPGLLPRRNSTFPVRQAHGQPVRRWSRRSCCSACTWQPALQSIPTRKSDSCSSPRSGQATNPSPPASAPR